MNKQKNIIIGTSSAFLLLAGFNGWPYDFFVLLRFIVCISGVYLAWLAYKTKQEKWIWTYGIIAVLFNPFFSLHFSRGTWVIVDIATAIFLITSGFLFKLKNNDSENESDYKLGFDYDKYFDVLNGRNTSRFEKNHAAFNPKFSLCLVDKIDNVSDKKIRINFRFRRNRGKNNKIEGFPSMHILTEALYIGSILCDDVILIKREEGNNENVVFDLDKINHDNRKVISIESPAVGKITIECKKIYAEKLDCYFQYANDKWRKEES